MTCPFRIPLAPCHLRRRRRRRRRSRSRHGSVTPVLVPSSLVLSRPLSSAQLLPPTSLSNPSHAFPPLPIPSSHASTMNNTCHRHRNFSHITSCYPSHVPVPCIQEERKKSSHPCTCTHHAYKPQKDGTTAMVKHMWVYTVCR